MLPKETSRYVFSKLEACKQLKNENNNDKSNSNNDLEDWKAFRYVYYSEGDLVLIMRSADDLFNAMDKYTDEVAFIPHRMQVDILFIHY